MKDRHLHIVCLDVPYPADYGGVIDIFYKVKALYEQGILIHLHCFEQGRGEQSILNDYCCEVNYYRRKEGHEGFSHKIPYIVCSRSSRELENALLKDDYPVLLEGLHSTYLLYHGVLSERKVLVRIQNVESVYYDSLYRHASSLFRKLYFFHERRVLKQYEQAIANKAPLIALNLSDGEYYRNHFSAQQVNYLPVFVPYQDIQIREGQGCFCLYHGNLSVDENEKAAIWLLHEVFNDLPVPLIIAGKKPTQRLARAVTQHGHACLVADPSEEEMQDLVRKAQVHVLPSFNCTGIKLKLLNALFNGRHCLVNERAIKDTGLESVCHTGNEPAHWKTIIQNLYETPLQSEEIEQRKRTLLNTYNNHRNAQQLIQWIW